MPFRGGGGGWSPNTFQLFFSFLLAGPVSAQASKGLQGSFLPPPFFGCFPLCVGPNLTMVAAKQVGKMVCKNKPVHVWEWSDYLFLSLLHPFPYLLTYWRTDTRAKVKRSFQLILKNIDAIFKQVFFKKNKRTGMIFADEGEEKHKRSCSRPAGAWFVLTLLLINWFINWLKQTLWYLSQWRWYLEAI